MALFRPELWIEGTGTVYPDDYDCTFKVAFIPDSDPGTLQVIMSRNWDGGADGIIFYYDNTADQAAVAWVIDGGVSFEVTALASRPSFSSECIGYLKSTSANVEAGWALISAPTSWVSATTTNPLPAHGTDNAMNLTSNSNGAYLTAQNWCGWDEALSQTTLAGEIYDEAIYRTNLIFEIKMDDGDVTSPWTNTASTGSSNDATQQGGSAPTNATNFLDPAPSGITAVAADTITLSDSAVAITTRVAVATDTIMLSESAVAITTRVAAATDTITLSESAVAITTRVAAATDTVTLSDSATAAVGFPVTASDTITLSDSAVATSSLVATASDTLTLSESAVAITTRVAAATDTLTLSESAVAIVTLVAAATDTLSLSDSAVGSVSTGGIFVNAADSVTLSDSAVALTTRVAAASDTLALSDSATAFSSLAATASDTLTLSDSAIAALGSQTYTAVASDTIVLSDSAVAVRPSPARSNFARQLLIEIYEREWAKKPAPEPVVAPVAAQVQPRKPKTVQVKRVVQRPLEPSAVAQPGLSFLTKSLVANQMAALEPTAIIQEALTVIEPAKLVDYTTLVDAHKRRIRRRGEEQRLFAQLREMGYEILEEGE